MGSTPAAQTQMQEVEELEHAGLMRLFGFMVGQRLSKVPVFLVVLTCVAALDPRPVRVGVIAAAAMLLAGFSWLEHRKFQRHAFRTTSLAINIFVTAGVQFVLILLTGGLSSPVTAALVLLSFVSSLLLGRSRFRWQLMGFMAACLTLLAIGHPRGWLDAFSPSWLLPRDEPGPGAYRPWIIAAVLTFFVGVGTVVGTILRQAFDAMLARAIEDRQDVLRTYVEQARDLTALSGEIAHELKNPLTSIKGLAGLLALDLTDGKPAERLATLRREVDRMQGILEEFLNFSRPLVPLSQSEFDLGELCADVARLHEGMARAKGVRMVVQGTGAVRGDPRKIRQILLNLVQNALEVSPSGGTLTLRVGHESGTGRVEVDDEGPGVREGLEDRVFEAGVTTRDHGSGLGLTIARALARQHGGDLTLSNRAGSGCRATLWIPAGGTE